MMPAWLPVKDVAVTPRSDNAMETSAAEMRSPAVSSMSSSRPGKVTLTSWAKRMSSSVVLPMALTTTATSWPWRRVRATWSATARIRSASDTDVPPNFWTVSPTRPPTYQCVSPVPPGSVTARAQRQAPTQTGGPSVPPGPGPGGAETSRPAEELHPHRGRGFRGAGAAAAPAALQEQQEDQGVDQDHHDVRHHPDHCGFVR